jgi:hypothetical protein
MEGFHAYREMFSVLTSALIDGKDSAPETGDGSVKLVGSIPWAAFRSISAL